MSYQNSSIKQFLKDPIVIVSILGLGSCMGTCTYSLGSAIKNQEPKLIQKAESHPKVIKSNNRENY